MNVHWAQQIQSFIHINVPNRTVVHRFYMILCQLTKQVYVRYPEQMVEPGFRWMNTEGITNHAIMIAFIFGDFQQRKCIHKPAETVKHREISFGGHNCEHHHYHHRRRCRHHHQTGVMLVAAIIAR